MTKTLEFPPRFRVFLAGHEYVCSRVLSVSSDTGSFRCSLEILRASLLLETHTGLLYRWNLPETSQGVRWKKKKEHTLFKENKILSECWRKSRMMRIGFRGWRTKCANVAPLIARYDRVNSPAFCSWRRLFSTRERDKVLFVLNSCISVPLSFRTSF